MRERGTSLVEFAVIAMPMFLVLFAVFEFSRIMLVYSTVASAARIAQRYAIVHGSRSSTPSGPDDTVGVEDIVKRYTGPATLAGGGLTIHVTYPDGVNAAGAQVSVEVIYAYNPLTIVPATMNLRSISTGVITY